MKTRFLKSGSLAIAAMLMLWGAVSCTNENDRLTDGKASIQFKLTDAPALNYDEVNIDIRGVRVGIADAFFLMSKTISTQVKYPGLNWMFPIREFITCWISETERQSCWPGVIFLQAKSVR